MSSPKGEMERRAMFAALAVIRRNKADVERLRRFETDAAKRLLLCRFREIAQLKIALGLYNNTKNCMLSRSPVYVGLDFAEGQAMNPYAAVIAGSVVVASAVGALAQENNIPEEVRALSILCSSGASIKFRGEIEGGLNRLFGKIIAGTGDLEVSENETDFLNSFSNENLKLEARRVYNECALGALHIVYNKRTSSGFDTSGVSIVVPEAISEISVGNRFALQPGGSVMLEKGGVFSVERPYSNDKKKPVVVVSNGGDSTGTVQALGKTTHIPNSRGCHVTFYHSRASDSGEQIVYSFLYDCSTK